ncbi:26S proteasome regulatory subunit 7 [Rhodotorula toruloides]
MPSAFAASELKQALSEIPWGMRAHRLLPDDPATPGAARAEVDLLEEGQSVTVSCSEGGWRIAIEFHPPRTRHLDNEGRAHILRIHARSMVVERNIRLDLIARLCPNSTGAELRSVCTEAGMFAIRQRREIATEKDFLDAVEKVIRSGQKFSSTSLYANYQ